MTRCIINCGNIKVGVFIYVYLIWSKKILSPNGFDDNYYRGEGHKSLFEDSHSECGGGTATLRYELISK